MKTPSNQLFKLIKCMTPDEVKRFILVSVQANGGTEPEYLELFRLIQKQKVYNEFSIRPQLNFKHFKRAKHYLLQNLFKFLAGLEPHSVERELNDLISAGNTLVDRGLFDLAIEIFEKARRKALLYEYHNQVLIIDEKLFHVHSHINNPDYVNDALRGVKYREFLRIINCIKIEEHFRIGLLKRWKFFQENTSVIREKKASYKLISMLEPYVSTGTKQELTLKAKHDFNILASFYYQEKKQTQKAIDYMQSSAKLAMEFPREYIGGMPMLLVALNNLIFIYAENCMFKELRDTLDRLYDSLPTKAIYRKIGLVSIMVYEAYYCKFHIDYSKRNTRLKWIEQEYIALLGEQRLLRHIQTAMNLSVNFFCEKKFKKALSFILELETYPGHVNFPQLTGLIKLYKLILYYEMGKHDLIPYAFRSTYRYLLKKATYKSFEKIVLSTLKKMIYVKSKREGEKILNTAYSNLLPLRDDAYEKSIFYVFNFIGWIKCKLHDREFKNLMTME